MCNLCVHRTKHRAVVSLQNVFVLWHNLDRTIMKKMLKRRSLQTVSRASQKSWPLSDVDSSTQTLFLK